MEFTFSITLILIGINVAVFLYNMSNPQALFRMTFINSRVRKNREYDRLFLAGFAHGGFMHLLFNMLTLYFFGPELERIIGPTLFLILFIGSIIGGNLYCLFLKKEDLGYAALGASGGVLGVIYGIILLAPNIGLSLFLLPISIPGWLFGILFSVISIVLSQLKRAAEARISHEGHLGGALVGSLIVMIKIDLTALSSEQIYFIAGGILPLILFLAVKWIAPQTLYRH